MNVFRHYRFELILFFSLLSLVIITFWQSLYLGFYRDDWSIWTSQYYFWEVLKGGHNHPGTWFEDYILFKILGFNSYLWQAIGLLLRAMAAFCVFLFVNIVTKSKKIAVISALLFAPSIIAMETVTWLSVYIVPQAIILSCLSFYFWIRYSESGSIRFGIISILLLLTSITGDPGRSIVIIPLIILWEILHWWISYKKESLVRLSSRCLLFLVTTISLSKLTLYFVYPTNISLLDNTKLIINNIAYLQSFYSSMGNLIFSWLSSPQGGNTDSLSVFIFFTSLFIGIYLTLLKKSLLGMAFLFFTIWIPFVYLPNWIFDPNFTSPPIYRYLGMSNVGYVAILAILFSYIPIKQIAFILTALFILLNLNSAYQVTSWELSYRSATFTEQLWNQIYIDVPKGERDSIFVYLGEDYAKNIILDWSGPIPYGIRANITDYNELPITTSDPKLILDLLCKDNVYRPYIFGWMNQTRRIPLLHLHGWELKNNNLRNVSVELRQIFQKEAEKISCNLIP